MDSIFSELVLFILKKSEDNSKDFFEKSNDICDYINKFKKSDLIDVVKQIGVIPENIKASSTEEKLFSKASDCILAKCFTEMGIPAKAVNERGNSADIIARSIHGYTLVADAKTFRLSRTAKNQKDFKIDTLSKWRGSEHDYSLLVAPYFQYPNTESQIYSSALETLVCLLSWEHITFLLENDVVENENLSLESIWEAPKRISRDSKVAFADRMNCHLPKINEMLCNRISKSIEDFEQELLKYGDIICERGMKEIEYLKLKKQQVESLTRDEAIAELIKSKKYNERINTIERFLFRVSR